MKTLILSLLWTFTTIIAFAGPADNIGRTLPHLELLTGTIHKNVTITAADTDGIVIATEAGETRISRHALPPAARVALGYPEDPDRIPREGFFRVVQIGGGGYVVRRHTPPAAAGSMQGLTDEIFGRTSIPVRPTGKDDSTAIFLEGKADGSIADGDIIYGVFIDLEATKVLQDLNTGANRTLRALTLIAGRRHAG